MQKNNIYPKEEILTEQKRKKSLRYSIADGSSYAATQGFGESFIGPLAVKIGSTSTQIGFLSAFPSLFAALFQLFSVSAIEKTKNRKKIILRSVFLQACIWIPMILNIMFWKSPAVIIVLFSLYSMLGSYANPAWSSMMGDLVKDDERGKYFGLRNKITGFIAFVGVFAGGIFLNYFAKISPLSLTGFIVLFAIAMAGRFFSYAFLRKMDEPPYKVTEDAYFSLWDFLKRMRFNNFGIFVIYICAMSFAVQIASPFFTVYMLRDMQFSFTTYTILVSVSSIVAFITMGYWGRYADRYGNKTIYSITGLIVPFVAILWAIPLAFFDSTRAYIWYLVPVQCLSGFVWAGFNLAGSNFIFDAVSPQKRARAIAYYSLLNGIAIFLGTITGGYLLTHITPFWLFHSKYTVLFFISGIARLAVSLYFLPKIREVRIVKRAHGTELFWKLLAVEPTRGLVYGAAHGIITGIEHLEMANKRITARLKFYKIEEIKEVNHIVHAINKILVKNLRPYNKKEINGFVDDYLQHRKQNKKK